MTRRLLTINGGSSSLKFALFADEADPRRLLTGSIDRIGRPEAAFKATDFDSGAAERETLGRVDHAAAADRAISWIERHAGPGAIGAVAHRVVHGGEKYLAAHVIDSDLVAEVTRLIPLAPQHLPPELALIDAFGRRFPKISQVACFDTAFHRNMPHVARLLPLPRRFQAAGMRRYGFHGLSYTYLLNELRRCAGDAAADGRVILAHLGSGSSLAAVRGGIGIDTSMGFTATGGLMMGTRPGDLDPGLLVWLLRNENLSVDSLEALLNREAGLMGVSETSSDMRDLLASAAADPRAADAVALFCYLAKKAIGSLTTVLGGLDTLVFAGGVGENAAPVRAAICQGLDYLGIHLDDQKNSAAAEVISADGSPATVRIIRTDEELTMVREMQGLLRAASRSA
ncbi:MAG: acetate/propionate family kinase [Planctomycetaceae bacterium]